MATIGGVAHHHHHAGEHGARVTADRRALTAALALILLLMAGELVAGILAGSLALLADAAHLLTDAAALGLALFAAAMAAKPARGAWTFGFRRLEIIAAQANGITLLLVGIWIVYAAVRRLVSPPDVQGGVVLVVALVGIAVNLVATALLARPSRQSLNVRGAYLHVATDLAAFVGTAAAGALVLATGWDRFDPLASLVVAALIFWAAWSLLRESTRILLEVSPGALAPGEIGHAILGVPHVVEVHDLHVWTVTTGFPAVSAHVLVEPGADCHGVRERVAALLGERFGLDHSTLQVEHAPAPGGAALPLVSRGRTPLRRR